MQLHKHLNARELAPRARFELATLRLTAMASSMSASDGFVLTASSAAALIICPGWQYPHCGTWICSQALCTGCDRSVDNPSIVVICLPMTALTGVTHERNAWPSTWTVHAPQRAKPQPNFVPVSPNCSRRTHSSGVAGSTSMVLLSPFIEIEVCPIRALLTPICLLIETRPVT